MFFSKLALKRCFITFDFLKISEEKFERDKNCISQTFKSRCEKPKTELFFECVLLSNRQWFYISGNKPLLSSLGEHRCQFQKQVNVHREILASKIGSENFILSQFTFKFSIFHVKLDRIVFATPKIIYENKSAVVFFRQKQKIYIKTSLVCILESKNCIYPLEIKLKKLNKVRWSQKDIWKQVNIRRAIPKTKMISEKGVQFMTRWFSAKSHRTN